MPKRACVHVRVVCPVRARARACPRACSPRAWLRHRVFIRAGNFIVEEEGLVGHAVVRCPFPLLDQPLPDRCRHRGRFNSGNGPRVHQTMRASTLSGGGARGKRRTHARGTTSAAASSRKRSSTARTKARSPRTFGRPRVVRSSPAPASAPHRCTTCSAAAVTAAPSTKKVHGCACPRIFGRAPAGQRPSQAHGMETMLSTNPPHELRLNVQNQQCGRCWRTA